MKKYIFILFIMTIMFGWNDEPEYNELDFICDLDGDGQYDCQEFYNYGNSSWGLKDYRECINYFINIFQCGCTAFQDADVYKKISSSYLKENSLNKVVQLDSALYYTKLGLKNNDDNIDLLQIASYVTGKQYNGQNNDKLDEQLYYLDEILAIDPNRTDILEQINNTLKNNELFEEQIIILDKWLEVDPTNSKAISDKKYAFGQLGKDESDVDRERWESDRTNIQYGISYVNTLIDNDEYDKAIEVGSILYKSYPKNKNLLRTLSQLYLDSYEDEEAVKYLEELVKIDSKNVDAMIDLSSTYINLSKFKKGYELADMAVNIEKKLGDSYFQRGLVLIALVENFESDKDNFCDRLIYDLAYDDFESAFKNGNINANKYKDAYEDYISMPNHWFLSGYKGNEISPSDKYCIEKKQSNCYDWINRTIKRKG